MMRILPLLARFSGPAGHRTLGIAYVNQNGSMARLPPVTAYNILSVFFESGNTIFLSSLVFGGDTASGDGRHQSEPTQRWLSVDLHHQHLTNN